MRLARGLKCYGMGGPRAKESRWANQGTVDTALRSFNS